MVSNASVEELVQQLHEDLLSTGWSESELVPDDIQEIIAVFCRNRRLLRVLLTLCTDD